MANKIIIKSFSGANSEGITLHLNGKTSLKTGGIQSDEFWVSWDKIGDLLFKGYTEEQTVEARQELRKD